MNWKKMCAVGVIGLYFLGLWFFMVIGLDVAADNFFLWLLVTLGCFTCLLAIHVLIKRISGKTWFTLSTLLLSLLIGGYYFTFGIMAQPSMGMIAAPVGVVLFAGIWALYAVISWFAIPLSYRARGKGKVNALKRAEETKRKVWILNIWQRRMICVGLFVIGLIYFFPPDQIIDYDWDGVEFRVNRRGFSPLGWGDSVRYTALFVEMAAAIVITGIVMYLVRDRSKKNLKTHKTISKS
ncbi:MAG: hypothetical protein ACYTE5_04475 [Planctomycetota bacterium]